MTEDLEYARLARLRNDYEVFYGRFLREGMDPDIAAQRAASEESLRYHRLLNGGPCERQPCGCGYRPDALDCIPPWSEVSKGYA